MIAAMLIVFREVLEMSLVLGILFSVTQGITGCRRYIATGALLGLLAAIVAAIFMQELEASADGDGEFIFNAVILLIASIFITWTVLWMSKNGRELSQRLKKVGYSVHIGDLPKFSLFTITLAAVMREGAEAVFFLFGIEQTGQDATNMTYGALIGLLAGALLGWLLYKGLTALPSRQLMQATSWLLILLAAGMASQAAWNLVVIDMLPPLVDSLWDTSQWLSQESLAGEFLHVMIGYDEQPSAMQLLVFITVLASILGIKHRIEHIKPVPSH